MNFSHKTLAALFFCAAAGFASASFAQSAQTTAPNKMMMAPKSSSMSKAAAPASLLDINSASEAELLALPGIGDKRATDIIKNRPYKGKDELVQKNVLSVSIYEKIKNKIIAKQK